MGVSSVNRHLGVISGMLTWAIGQGHIHSNVISGKSLKSTVRADKQRKIFSTADLKKIFGRKYRGKHPYCKWLPLMALYSGARLEELASLHKSDIRKINDIWCYDINTEHGRRVKNAYSVRLVPIHSVLIKQLYFLDFVKSVKHERLFPELKLYRGKYSKEASKWFGRYLDRLGITDPKKSFHSLRHNVMDYLKQHRIEDPLVKSLTGQSGGSLSLDRYGKPYVAETLQQVVEQLEFPITES